MGSLDELIQGNLAAVCGVEQKFQVSGGAGDGVKPESGEVSGGIATVLRQLAKFLRLEVMCLPNRETNYELCHQLTGLDHLDHLEGFSPSADNQREKGKERMN